MLNKHFTPFPVLTTQRLTLRQPASDTSVNDGYSAIAAIPNKMMAAVGELIHYEYGRENQL